MVARKGNKKNGQRHPDAAENPVTSGGREIPMNKAKAKWGQKTLKKRRLSALLLLGILRGESKRRRKKKKKSEKKKKQPPVNRVQKPGGKSNEPRRVFSGHDEGSTEVGTVVTPLTEEMGTVRKGGVPRGRQGGSSFTIPPWQGDWEKEPLRKNGWIGQVFISS